MAKKKRSLKYEQVLETTLEFDDVSIAANARGELSEKQRQSLKGRVTTASVIAALSLLVTLGSLLSIAFDPVTSSVGVVTLIFAGLFGLIAGFTAYIRAQELRRNRVDSVEGSVRLNIASSGRGGTTYNVIIGEMVFQVSKTQFLAFKNGDPYRLYYLPDSKRLLSAEWLVVDRDVNEPTIAYNQEATFDNAPDETSSAKRLRG